MKNCRQGSADVEFILWILLSVFTISAFLLGMVAGVERHNKNLIKSGIAEYVLIGELKDTRTFQIKPKVLEFAAKNK